MDSTKNESSSAANKIAYDLSADEILFVVVSVLFVITVLLGGILYYLDQRRLRLSRSPWGRISKSAVKPGETAFEVAESPRHNATQLVMSVLRYAYSNESRYDEPHSQPQKSAVS